MPVRRFRSDDAQAIGYILADGWREAYGAFMPPQVLEKRTSREQRASEIAHFLATDFDPSRETFLVSEKEQVDGFVHIVLQDKAGLGADAHINLLYVAPHGFGQGTGRALMVGAARWLDERIKGAIVLSAYAQNPYRGFYAHIGGELVKCDTAILDGHALEAVYYRWRNPGSLLMGATRR